MRKIKRWRRMLFLTEEQGFSVIELFVALTILAIAIGGAYQILYHTRTNMDRVIIESWAVQDARLAVMNMSNEIRQARQANETDAAVVIWEDTPHLLMDIYTLVPEHQKPVKVTYRIPDYFTTEGNPPLQRGVATATNNNFPYVFGAVPQWEVVIDYLLLDPSSQPFTISGSAPRLMINMNFQVIDSDVSSESIMHNPITIDTTLTLRSRGNFDE